MESCSFKLGVGLNIPLQENTKLKYVSRWACTLTVRTDGTMRVDDGRPHNDEPTGKMKVNGVRTESAEVSVDDTVTFADRYTLPLEYFQNCFTPGWTEPQMVVDREKERQFNALQGIEKRFQRWDMVYSIATRYAFMSLSPLLYGVIRGEMSLSGTIIWFTMALFLLFLGLILLSSRYKRMIANRYRCPFCGKKLMNGVKLRLWEDLSELNQCPRSHKHFHTKTDPDLLM